MGKKIKKSDILNNIQAKINTCREYQKLDPDSTAANRIKLLENDPCGDLKYYVNITLNSCRQDYSVSLSDRLKYIENRRKLLQISELNDFYEEGCVITVSIKNPEKSWTLSAVQCDSFEKILNILISKYLDKNCIVYSLNPKTPTSGENFLADDIDMAINSNKSFIVYGMARFNKKSIKQKLTEYFNSNKYELYSYSVQNFYEVKYIDMTRRTAFEQNVNQFLGGNVINSVTMFTSKNRIPNFSIMNDHGVYDIGKFIIESMEEIRKNDIALASKKYEQYSEGIFKDISEAKYDMFKKKGGDESWTSWNIAQNQFLSFKSISSYDSEFKQEAMENNQYMNNLYAFEQTSEVFSNSEYECIDQYWKRESNFFKKNPVDLNSVIFGEKVSENGKAYAKTFISENLVDPPSIKVNPYGESKISFDETKTYNFKTNVPFTEGKTQIAGYYVSKPDDTFEKVDGYFVSSNRIQINRDSIFLDNIEYVYTNVELEFDNGPYSNELDGKESKTVPAESYYNENQQAYFKAAELEKRIMESTVLYSIIPLKVSIPVEFIQHSYWNTLAAAREIEKTVREEYQNNFKRIAVDSIPYDPWNKLVEKLEQLYGKWSKVIPDSEGYFEFSPLEENTNNVKAICRKCGNSVENCTCDRIKLCTKSFPFTISGIETDSSESKFNTSIHIMKFNGTPASFAELASEIYYAVYKDSKNIGIDYFCKLSEYSKLVLNIKYETLVNTTAFKSKHSLISQLNSEDFSKFKLEYSELLENKEDVINRKFSKTAQIGLVNGFIYIPTGFEITFTMDAKTKELSLDGIPKSLFEKLSELENCEDFEKYKSIVDNTVEYFQKIDLPENVQKFLAYPCIPDINKMLDSKETGLADPVEKDFSKTVYKLNYSDYKINEKSGKKEIPVKFSIYTKKAIICSYPECKNPMYENIQTDGVCGLNEFFKTPMITGSSVFNFNKEIEKRYIELKKKEIRKKSNKFIDDVNRIKLSACNADKNLNIIDGMKSSALDRLYEFGSKYRDLLRHIPDDPLNKSEKTSIIKETARKIKNVSIVDDYENIFSHSINTIVPIKDGVFSQNSQKFNSIMSELPVCSDIISSFYAELSEKSKEYDLCSEKYSEYIGEKGELKTLKNGTIEQEQKTIMQAFEAVIKQRIINYEIYNNIKELNLDEEEARSFAQMISNGDMLKIKAFVEEHSQLFKNIGTSIEAIIKYFTRISKTMNSVLDMVIPICRKFFGTEFVQTADTNAVETNSGNEIKHKAVDLSELSENTLAAVCGASSDIIENQNSSQVSQLVTEKSVNEDIITSIEQFISESCRTYRELTFEYLFI